MKKIVYAILAVAAIFATSCQSKLDIPQKGVISEETFYNSGDAAAEALLANMYVSCFGAHGIAGSEGIYNNQLMLLNYSSDDVLAAGGDPEDHSGFREFDEFRYDHAFGSLQNLYNGYAQSIFAANLIISNYTNENKDAVDPIYTSDYTAQCVAEARVFRAYMHMMMALCWYQPNIVDRLLTPDEFPVQATSQKEVLDFVIADCKKAIDSGKLPVRSSVNDKDATARMSLGFAQFVAGKAAMFNNDPATARQYLGALIESGKYALVPSEDYWTNFHVAGDGNSEKIFAPNFIEDPAFTTNGWGSGSPIQRGRWMIADVLCWRTDRLASAPSVCEKLPGAGGGWNGGAITEAFAEKFLAHDGNSPRRRATFITEEEFLYEMDWSGSAVNDGTRAQKEADDKRGISNSGGIYSHSKYFEWKNMVFYNAPKLLAGDKAASYPADNIATLGANSNQTNMNICRYAEALLLYAEACIGSADEAKGLKALNEIQVRSGSGKVSTSLTFEDVMEEKQYELWFEGARFHDLVRWAAQGKVDLDKVFNQSKIHENIPTVYDKFFTEKAAKHELYVTYTPAHYNNFEKGKHEYFPFPRDIKVGNPNLQDVLGWAYLNE
ncbi:MAG: RagB/SusD family nutrient uptake outer membrane protein [Bacteroidales bacterium]|nr:RagB/SusD family nutrient uptake outer membrane protein [Bacteroidales bacterium]